MIQQRETQLLGALLGAIDATVCITDACGVVTHASPVLRFAIGKALGQLAGQSALATLVQQVLDSGEPREGLVSLSPLEGLWQASVTPAGEYPGCIAVLRLQHAADDLQSGVIDRLTGLPGRHLFFDRLDQAIHHAEREKKSVAVILASFDRISQIADALGSDDYEHVLKEIAERLRQCVRVSDTVARIEHDRFAFVTPVTAVNDSVLVTGKILQAFEHSIRFASGQEITIDCLLGVSLFPADGATASEVVKNAAAALHHAGQESARRCQFFSNEMNTRARRRLSIESGLRRALGNQEFLVYYQPKIDVRSRRVAGMEALVRWRDPERGLISPGEFIPVAEESGLIEQIGHWVLEETCRQNRDWQAAGLAPVRASVNVSARQFRNPNFVARVEDVLARTGLDPRWLELEITESMLMGDIDAIVARMEDLRRVGISLSIDDFGTGYSSLSYLSRFPITTLKIDRAFIADVQANANTAEIARAIIGLSHGLNLEVVAEGAEIKEQIDFLHQHGCLLVQGFYFSRPLPADEFALMLQHGPDIAERHPE